MACASPIQCNTIQEGPCDMWYLDSGCNNHMTGNLNLFYSLANSVQTNATPGNNIQVTVLGKSTVGFLTKQRERKSMPYFYHVEGMKHNLLSIEKLIQKGYKVYMEENHCVIKDICPSS